MNVWQFMVQNHTEVLELTLEHLWLVGASTVLAVLIGIPLGIAITRWPALNKPVLGSANVIQTIPSLALFGFLLPAPWIGARADRLAILALTLYALLPLIRNTYTGIKGVDPAVVEAGRGMGMTGRQLLWQVELPLALGSDYRWCACGYGVVGRIGNHCRGHRRRRFGRIYFSRTGDGEQSAHPGGSHPGCGAGNHGGRRPGMAGETP